MAKFIRGAISARGRKGCSLGSGENVQDSLLDREWIGDRSGRRLAVPKGFLAVYVGEEMRRFVIPTRYLCLPPFRELMERVAEEFGFEQEGGLRIPCDEATFEQMLNILEETAATKNKKKRQESFKWVR